MAHYKRKRNLMVPNLCPEVRLRLHCHKWVLLTHRTCDTRMSN